MPMPVYVEWYAAHLVDEPAKMMVNQQWAEGVYAMLTCGTYVRRDGGLYQLTKKGKGSNVSEG